MRRFKTIELGSWDMDSVQNHSVEHGIDDIFKKIFFIGRGVEAVIKTDTGEICYYFLNNDDEDRSITIDLVNINFYTKAGGFFDNSNFADASKNRGFVTLSYKDVEHS